MLATTELPAQALPITGEASIEQQPKLPLIDRRNSTEQKVQYTTYRRTFKQDSNPFQNCISPSEPPVVCIVQIAPTTDSVFDVALASLRAKADASSSSVLETDREQSSHRLALIYALEKDGHPRQAAREAMIAIEKRLQRNALHSVNEFLLAVDTSVLSARTLVGIIRSTHRVSQHLPAWNTSYKRSWKRAKDLGKSPESLFIGLPKVGDE
jgi:hypothetical protein